MNLPRRQPAMLVAATVLMASLVGCSSKPAEQDTAVTDTRDSAAPKPAPTPAPPPAPASTPEAEHKH